MEVVNIMKVSSPDFQWLQDAINKARKFKPSDWVGSANSLRVPSVKAVDLGVVLPKTGWLRIAFVDRDNKEKTLLLEEDLTNFSQVVKGVGFDNSGSTEPVVIKGASVVFSTRWVLSFTPWRAVVEFKNVNGVRYRFDGMIPLGRKISDYFAGFETYLQRLVQF